MARVYLSLGSNLDPLHHLPIALDKLRTAFGKLDVSPAYRNKSLGFEGPDFVNMVVALDTDLDPYALNDGLYALEKAQGRCRSQARYANRTLDIDIVIYDDLVIHDGPGHLSIPRKELQHAFVLKPLADLAPDLRHPTLGLTMAVLWADFVHKQEVLEEISLE